MSVLTRTHRGQVVGHLEGKRLLGEGKRGVVARVEVEHAAWLVSVVGAVGQVQDLVVALVAPRGWSRGPWWASVVGRRRPVEVMAWEERAVE